LHIVVNASRDGLRTRGGAKPLPEDVFDARSIDPADEAETRELGEIVAAEVSRLPPRQREVLVLIAYEGLSNAEAARMLDVTEQNVRTTLHLARERLRGRLAKYLPASERR
jgi:RNA polymerase sigma factor (sigma-70 family)